jgi:hypothetical protein
MSAWCYLKLAFVIKKRHKIMKKGLESARDRDEGEFRKDKDVPAYSGLHVKTMQP